MIINRIEGETCKAARPLWEEVFYEDSVQFTDYYFRNKAEKNIGYVIGQVPFNAMMFRTPYHLQIGEWQREISYIVGVATRKEYRHRGYMRALLMHSFEEMYQEKNPFTFLMPANPAIYEPFDFQYVYERENWTLKEPEKEIFRLESLTAKTLINRAVSNLWEEESEYELRAAESGNSNHTFFDICNKLNGLYSVASLLEQIPNLPIMELLTEFSNQYLKENFNIYVRRDKAYYEMQLEESKAQNGDIYVMFENGQIKAFFLYAREEDEVFIQEVMESEVGLLDFLQRAEKKKPIIMARIIHLEEMMKLVCSKENRTVIIEVKDKLIPENAGIYEWEITPKGSSVIRLKERQSPEVSMHIRELVSQILTGVFINEIV